MKIGLLFHVILLITNSFQIFAVSENPTWIEYEKRKQLFPTSTYLIGFASEEANRYETSEEIQERLKSYCRTQLVESVYTSIKSITTTDIIVQNSVTDDKYRQTSVSFSKVNISGLTVETYYDEEQKIHYAICWAQKADVSNLYKNIIESNKIKIEKNIAQAQAFAEQNNSLESLKSWYNCNTLFTEIEEAQTLIIAFEGLSFNAPVLFFDEINELKSTVQKGIANLTSSENATLETACYSLVNALALQLQEVEGKGKLISYTYEDSDMAGAFSKFLYVQMEKEFIVQTIPLCAQNQNADWFISGTYWKTDNGIKIYSIVRNIKTGEAIAAADISISEKWLAESKIELVPDNYAQALENMNIIRNSMLISEGGLVIDISTNRGIDNLIFTEGDTLKLYVTANKACYLRFIYYLADGSKVLLLDNYYINNAMANRVIEIPQYFICAAPFGIENLQLNAQTEKFSALKTRKQYGYNFIENNITEIQTIKRGFVPVDEKDAIAEKNLVFTTLKRN